MDIGILKFDGSSDSKICRSSSSVISSGTGTFSEVQTLMKTLESSDVFFVLMQIPAKKTVLWILQKIVSQKYLRPVTNE